MHHSLAPLLLALVLAACSTPRTDAPPDRAPATSRPSAIGDTLAVAPTDCGSCAEWNQPHAPFRLYGNSYYVGTDGLSAVLVTSPEGHVLIDGALAESAPLIAANVEALGFRMEDVKLILNTHAHFDHAAGIAGLQRMSGATVAASPASARVLESGMANADDPQYGDLLSFPAATGVRRIADGDTLRVGPLALAAHFTPGHMAGGTTWSWRSCESGRCLTLVYADSISPISVEGYRFSDHPETVAGFTRTAEVLDGLACDVLVTPHPSGSDLWTRLAARDAGNADALVDGTACWTYAVQARERLAERLASEH